MSTVIKDYQRIPALDLRAQSRESVLLGCVNNEQSHLSRLSSVPRADFLAAVAAECDAIVIPREDLPERVSPSTDGKWLWADSWNCLATATPDDARRAARAYLALAEHLDAHPPVDEAKVEALAEVMRGVQNLNSIPEVTRDYARRLLATGRIEVKP